jgi:hypothetical protein
MSCEADLGEVLYGFGLHEGIFEGESAGEEAVVGEENGVMVGDEWLKTGSYFFGAGGGVRGERNEAGGHEDLRADGLIEWDSAGREGGGDRRMGVDDGLDIRTQAIDGEVHSNLAGDFARAGYLLAVVIDDDHVGVAEQGLAVAGWRGEDEVGIEPDGEVAGGTGGVAEAMDPATEANELSSQIGLDGIGRRCEVGVVQLNGLLG